MLCLVVQAVNAVTAGLGIVRHRRAGPDDRHRPRPSVEHSDGTLSSGIALLRSWVPWRQRNAQLLCRLSRYLGRSGRSPVGPLATSRLNASVLLGAVDNATVATDGAGTLSTAAACAL